MRPEVKQQHHFYTKMFGPEKGAGSCSTFLGPKSSIFQIYKKYLFLKDFQGKLVVPIFGGKAMLERGQTKMITVLGMFEFDVFSCVFGF